MRTRYYLQQATAANMLRKTRAPRNTRPLQKQTRERDGGRHATWRKFEARTTTSDLTKWRRSCAVSLGCAPTALADGAGGAPATPPRADVDQNRSCSVHVAARDRAARRARPRMPFRRLDRSRHWCAARRRVGVRRDCECVPRSRLLYHFHWLLNSQCAQRQRPTQLVYRFIANY